MSWPEFMQCGSSLMTLAHAELALRAEEADA